MSERIARKDLDVRIESLNRRMESRGSVYRYTVEGRMGYFGLDRETRINGKMGRVDTVRTGTKREIGELLHVMMVALDDAATTVRL